MTTENEEKEEENIIPAPDPVAEALRKENEQLKESIRMRSAAYEIETALTKAGARSPRLLTDTAKAKLQFAEDGSVANAAAVVEHMKREFPEQFGSDAPATSIDGGAGRNNAPAITKESLALMKPAEIQRLDWEEVRSVLAN